jgi:xylulokinase
MITERDMAKILTIDLGTTYFKTSLFDRSGRLCDTCRMAPPTAAAQAGWLELSGDGFCGVMARGIAELRTRAGGDLSDVEAVTFATQANSFLLLDAEDRPLTPLILWPDRRAAEKEEEVLARCGFAGFFAATGIPHLNLQCMAAKLLWLQEQSPDLWKRTKRLCLISDYLTLLLTGRHVTEAGAAGLTGLVDIHRCRWHPEMLARFGIEADLLPAIVRAGTDLGPLDRQAAERWGLPESCRFVVGCLDQYAGAIGTGNVEPGIISETTGTVLATVQCADRFDGRPQSNVIQGPAFREGLFWRMTFGGVSANYLEWFQGHLPDRPDVDQLISLAESIAPGAEGLRLKTDAGFGDPAEVFDGLAAHHTRGHRVCCILEAVACALADQVAVLCDGSPPKQIRCAGGAARSDLWLQIKADVSGVATAATVCPEPTSLGAAVLVQATLGGAEVPAVARQWICLKPPHHPHPQRHRQYHVLRCKPTT